MGSVSHVLTWQILVVATELSPPALFSAIVMALKEYSVSFVALEWVDSVFSGGT
jgi:hypothetical protein